MRVLFQLCLSIVYITFVGLGASAQSEVKKKVAVYITGDDVENSVKKIIGAKLVTAITASGEYAAVERTADFLAALEKESDYQTSGEVRDSQIAKLGQKFGVRFVVVADVSEAFDELFVASRLINVETGLVERAYDASGPAESMQQLIKLSQNVAKGLFRLTLKDLSHQRQPVHLSSAVKLRDGSVIYIKPSQWERIGRGDTISGILGVCVIDKDKTLLIGMENKSTSIDDWDPSKRLNAPSLQLLAIMYRYRKQINDLMKVFGGDEIKPAYYWAPGFDYKKSTKELNWLGTPPKYDHFPNVFDMEDGTEGYPQMTPVGQQAYIREISVL